MAITRQKKEEIIAKVADIAGKAKTMVFAGFRGLPVAEQTQMRRELKAQGIGYVVAKKSLLRRALENAGFAGQAPELPGEVALVWGAEDELAPAREFAVFAKKFPEQLALLGGVFGGAFVGKEEITSIAAIPGMQALRAMFAQVINSPRQRFAVVLGKVAETKS